MQPNLKKRPPSSQSNKELVMSRRRFLFLTGAAGAAISLAAGCDYFPPESGPAFAPWQWPENGSRPEIHAVGAAILAASPHNIQPWWFEIGDGAIDLYADMSRSLGPLDSYHREMRIGLGCALENLRLAAEPFARGTELLLFPDEDETHIASVLMAGDPIATSPLVRYIPRRHTNRGPYVDREAPAGLTADLEDLIVDEEIRVTVLRSPGDRNAFAGGVIDGTRAIIADREMNETSHRWYRHSEEEIAQHRDGLMIDTTGLGAGTRFFGKIGSRPDAEKAGEYWLRNTIRNQTSAGAFCILSAPMRHNPLCEVLCGQTYQRMHLFATSVGLAMQPLNQMPELADREEALGIAPEFTERLQGFVGGDRVPLMAFRIGYPVEEPFASCRKPVAWVSTEGV